MAYRTLERNPNPTIAVIYDADLDSAYLHRFGYSLRLSIPRQVVRMRIAEQHWQLFRQKQVRLGGRRPAASKREEAVHRLERLTPGDFAVAARQFALGGNSPTAVELYDRLVRECEAKAALHHPIGFCH